MPCYKSPILLLMLWSSVLSAQSGARITSVTATDGGVQVPVVPPATGLDSRISITLEAVPFARALETIAREATLRISVTDGVARVTKRVTLRARDMSAADAFKAVLNGTGVQMTVAPDGQVLFAVLRAQSPPQAGRVSGRVTDSATTQPIAGATATIENETTRLSVRTNENGQYTIIAPVGTFRLTVRALGYAPVGRTVTVGDAEIVTADFSLSAVPHRLQEIVTTGAGERMRLEVGNSIGTIDASAIVPTTPIRNLSDLLKGRVPGMQVLTSAGTVGSGSRVRIRGVSSILTNADPIVIVDGVRIDAAFSQSQVVPSHSGVPGFVVAPGVNQVTQSGPATSRLNDIDPESIESIDILKGPAASTLYGSEAANGVIVIKTKRGRAGPTRWSFSTEHGTSRMKAEFLEAWRGWGTNVAQPNSPHCRPQVEVVQGICQLDSVTHFNPLNHAGTTTLGTGRVSHYGAQVSGGSQQLQYFLSASYKDQLGLLKLPDEDAADILTRRNGDPLPDWFKRPNVLKALHVAGNITAQLGPKADIAFSTNVTRQYHRDAAQGSGGFVLMSYVGPGYRDSLTRGWGTNNPSQSYASRISDEVHRGYGGLSGNWRPTEYFSARGTVGADYTVRSDQSLRRANEIPGVGSGTGSRSRNDAKTLVRALDLGASLELPVWRSLRMRSTAGGQYTRQDVEGVSVSSSGIGPGSEIVNDGTNQDMHEFFGAAATAGWYFQQTAMLNERLFLTAAVRGDAGSAFGEAAKTVLYPKWNASWLVSEEPFFPWTSLLNSVRLRAAFGHAGVQPGNDVRFRSFRASSGFVNGVSVPSIAVRAVGNPALRPERSTEFEGGFDLGFFGDRVTLDLTVYRKLTNDALVTRTLPPSLGITTRQENVGKVENRGTEISSTIRPVITPMLDWSMSLQFSQNSNKLLELAPGSMPFEAAAQNRYVAGYPLNGWWQRALLGYADVNGDGYIDPRSEIRMSDSAVYMGQPFPKGAFAFYNNLSFLSGAVTVSTGFNYVHGLTQYNEVRGSQCNAGRCQAVIDPTTSLADQAEVANKLPSQYGDFRGPFETVSWLRWDTFSVTARLPQSMRRWFGAENTTVSIMGRNLRTWSRYKGADPEVNTSSVRNDMGDQGGVPQPQEWSIRLNLGY
jgi:TonB-linked SusC/RagA family outer membrane protein